ncbi:uncharacterized protein LOC111389601 [Olea europaea var. sylvestris]|uniref:uncharacterized protein LOC111389601 n=1 Tax=Olea europaea var. sylvestris TaxID=158386 RepID=UPI000C1CDA43|nr:uncharacterized protein LOC111389601 [Olea europaea var. sylvestris]
MLSSINIIPNFNLSDISLHSLNASHNCVRVAIAQHLGTLSQVVWGPLDLDSDVIVVCFIVFHSRKSLCNWVRMVGKELGLVIVIIHSEHDGYGRKPRISYGYCEPKRKRSIGTHKCECLFDLNGVKLLTEDDWMLKVSCRLHNHPPTQHSERRPCVQRLTNEEEQILIYISKSMVKPRNILMALKERDPNNVSTMRTICNACARHRLIEKEGKTQMQ